MKERPIPFSGPMVRAVLADTKTQTRRVVKLNAAGRAQLGGRNWHLGDPDVIKACPYGQPGDRLWVRESYSGPHSLIGRPPRDWPESTPILYWADGNPARGDWMKPKPPMHMPRWASRITLEIVSVRVERLNEISEKDAAAEGLGWHSVDGGSRATEWFCNLWESINGAGSWDANPWVWVIEFKRID